MQGSPSKGSYFQVMIKSIWQIILGLDKQLQIILIYAQSQLFHATPTETAVDALLYYIKQPSWSCPKAPATNVEKFAHIDPLNVPSIKGQNLVLLHLWLHIKCLGTITLTLTYHESFQGWWSLSLPSIHLVPPSYSLLLVLQFATVLLYLGLLFCSNTLNSLLNWEMHHVSAFFLI